MAELVDKRQKLTLQLGLEGTAICAGSAGPRSVFVDIVWDQQDNVGWIGLRFELADQVEDVTIGEGHCNEHEIGVQRHGLRSWGARTNLSYHFDLGASGKVTFESRRKPSVIIYQDSPQRNHE